MYVPQAFRIEELDDTLDVLRQHPFATLVSVVEGEPVASHVPILFRRDGDELTLLGHLAKANPHWRALETVSSLAIFHGPHGYVSPTWYVSRPNVPTWNYVAVHAYGRARLIEDPARVIEGLQELTLAFDPELPSREPSLVEPNLLRKMIPGIVMFELKVERLEGKAKLNQNKIAADFAAVRARYLESENTDERAMAQWMGRLQAASDL